jgi:hypothetical protein
MWTKGGGGSELGGDMWANDGDMWTKGGGGGE